MPRTLSSTFTPAWLARYSAWQISGSWSELILAMIRPGRSGGGDLDLAVDQVEEPLPQAGGRDG